MTWYKRSDWGVQVLVKQLSYRKYLMNTRKNNFLVVLCSTHRTNGFATVTGLPPRPSRSSVRSFWISGALSDTGIESFPSTPVSPSNSLSSDCYMFINHRIFMLVSRLTASLDNKKRTGTRWCIPIEYFQIKFRHWYTYLKW